MPKLNPNLFLDEEFEMYVDRRQHRRTGYKPNYNPKRSPDETIYEMTGDVGDSLDFSYNASRHEREWIINSLGGFYDQQWFDDVLRLLKGGKEASVYQCLANGTTGTDFLAAKIYRPRRFRNLKNDHLYREGRVRLDEDGNQIINGGMHHAMNVRSAYGLQLLHTSWIEHEYQALQILHAVGARVPAPYARGDNAILMEFIGDENMPAPTMNSIDLSGDEARSLFERVLREIEIMLANDRIHADLSAYNILYWDGEITLIDFPQAIHPSENRNAFRIFERDVTRICEYFNRQGLHADPKRIAKDMWTAYNHRLSPDVHPGLLNGDDEADRAYWQNIVNKDDGS
jgi:RIO kinase 1